MQKRFLLSFSSFFTEITNLNRKNNYILGFTRKTFAYADNSYTIYLAYLIIVRKKIIDRLKNKKWIHVQGNSFDIKC